MSTRLQEPTNSKHNQSIGPLALQYLAAIAAGAFLSNAVSLHPVWWFAWIAPLPLLILALSASDRHAAPLVTLAALTAYSVDIAYLYRLTNSPVITAIMVAVQALFWTAVVTSTRRIVLRYPTGWTAFAYPIFWVMADTLKAALLPDGNVGSLAYTQVDNLPVLQITSLFGIPGLLFILCLIPSTLAVALTHRQRPVLRLAFDLCTSPSLPVSGGVARNEPGWVSCLRDLRPAYACVALVLAATLGYGTVRLHHQSGPTVRFGMAAIDDYLGPMPSSTDVARVWRNYDLLIASLASRGARVVVLPEKIAPDLPASEVQRWQDHFSASAAQNHVWLAVGIGLPNTAKPVNACWLFTPDGALDATYVKHYLAPPERGAYDTGRAYSIRDVDGHRFGLAICKDMHFAALGRANGLRGPSAMLVPAWDFDADGVLAARVTLTRGVENGYGVIRSARNGMLTASDPFGHIIAERSSASGEGAALLADVPVDHQMPTLYTLTGDILGWLCVAAGIPLVVIGQWRRRA